MRTLEQIRKDFDTTDREICRLLEKRMSLAQEIAKVKRIENIPIVQRNRQQEVMAQWVDNCPSFAHESIKQIYNIIHEESVKQQL
ncbi:MAG: chorismate mutase [bacterium]|nr:chorismate mutase [Candidatus Minthenecus merdequi]